MKILILAALTAIDLALEFFLTNRAIFFTDTTTLYTANTLLLVALFINRLTIARFNSIKYYVIVNVIWAFFTALYFFNRYVNNVGTEIAYNFTWDDFTFFLYKYAVSICFGVIMLVCLNLLPKKIDEWLIIPKWLMSKIKQP
jgi:hypothetical protein